MNLSDADQAPYSAPAPQTAIVSDEAVQAMPERIWTCNETRNIWIGEKQDDTTEYVRADIAAAHCSVEVKKLEWVQQDGKLAWDSSEYRIYVLLGSKPAVYRLLKASFGTQYAGDFVGVNALEAAKAAAQADFERRILSKIVTKPVDVAAVRRAAFSQGLEAAARYHNHEAEYYKARHGDKDGVPFPIVAGWHRLDAQRIRDLSPAEPVDQWQDMKALSELSKLTYAIQHNPNCPDRYLVRLPGKAGIDLKPYGNAAFRTPNQTNDILGFGKTLHEAYIAATAAPTSKGGE